METFLEEGKDEYLQYPPGFSAIFYPAARNVHVGRASGGFCLFFNTRTVKVKPSEFKAISDSIFYGPVQIHGIRIYIVMVYRTRNEGSAVYDNSFDDNLNYLVFSLRDERIILGGNFNAKVGDMTGPFSFIDDAGRFIPESSESTETDKAGANLLSVLSCHDLFGLYDLSSGRVRNTFCNHNGVGGSVVDFAFVNDRVLPNTLGLDCTFYKPANHARLTVTFNLETDSVPGNYVEAGNAKRYLRMFNLNKLLNVKHTDGLISLARDPTDFTVQSALDVILDFVDIFTELVEVRRRPQEKLPVDTK